MEQLLSVRLWAWPLDISSSLSYALWNLTWKASLSLEPHLKSHPPSISTTSHFLHPALLLVMSQLTSCIFHLVIPLFLPHCNASLTEGREFCSSPLLSPQCLSISSYSVIMQTMNEPTMVGPFINEETGPVRLSSVLNQGHTARSGEPGFRPKCLALCCVTLPHRLPSSSHPSP